jgi:hypothetical protein
MALHPVLTNMLQKVKVRFLGHDYVFTNHGEPINPMGSCKKALGKACEKAGMENFHFTICVMSV